jgi:L-asparaginase / beta-aspartyl-peptidase
MRKRCGFLYLLFALFVITVAEPSAAQRATSTANRSSPDGATRDWAIAIHGGAGTIARDMDPKLVEAYRTSLKRGLEIGTKILEKGGTSLEACESVVHFFEDDSLFNAGVGAVYTHEGSHELDAAIMDGSNLACGSVTGVRTVRNPIVLARLVMQKSPHVFFAGAGAEAFAREQGLPVVDPKIFDTRRRYEQLQKALADDKHGTVGCVALDRKGHLAAATSTGGLTDKRWGRIGDTPIIGAGTWADDRNCAVSCTGKGEQMIRHVSAHDVAALYEYKGLTLREAAAIVVHAKLDPGDGGLIAVSRTGEIALVYNSDGMYRGAADSSGRSEVAIWEK